MWLGSGEGLYVAIYLNWLPLSYQKKDLGESVQGALRGDRLGSTPPLLDPLWGQEWGKAPLNTHPIQAQLLGKLLF